ncbi:hypothetical protein GCM10009550_20000 [Actinocorallia libanotica]|uniref:Uncharacterized protein n=2 Tax=Actinocorallia libanotica TaxID=46162 RepID=A0ABN1QQT4_9ACTN
MEKELEEATEKARASFYDLFGIMIAHELDFPTLHRLLVWPNPVKTAYEYWLRQMNDVARILAYRDGVEPGAKLSESDRVKLTARAWELVSESVESASSARS